MGAKTDLAVVRGAQVMAIALLVGVAYTSTMELIKQKKIDLNGWGAGAGAPSNAEGGASK